MLHHPSRQRGVQWRQGQLAIPDQFGQLPARAEQEDRAELRVEHAADDELVAIELDHRLDGHAQEVLGAVAPVRRIARSRAIGWLTALGIGSGCPAHLADAAHVGDRLGEELQDRAG